MNIGFQCVVQFQMRIEFRLSAFNVERPDLGTYLRSLIPGPKLETVSLKHAFFSRIRAVRGQRERFAPGDFDRHL
jgi:hypothetical protein